MHALMLKWVGQTLGNYMLVPVTPDDTPVKDDYVSTTPHVPDLFPVSPYDFDDLDDSSSDDSDAV